MDLWTVREELRGDNYANPTEFWKDVKLIFANSKIYSPDPRSKVLIILISLINLFIINVSNDCAIKGKHNKLLVLLACRLSISY